MKTKKRCSVGPFGAPRCDSRGFADDPPELPNVRSEPLRERRVCEGSPKTELDWTGRHLGEREVHFSCVFIGFANDPPEFEDFGRSP